jgi:hypothetical protein
MATRNLTYKVCDGCYRTDLAPQEPDPVEIVSTKTVTQFCGPTKTIDICADCDLAGKYYCRFCDRVHTDDNPCDGQLREIEAAEAFAKEMMR